jgi:methanogenic corrinoid protein MtbC1
VAGDEAGAMAVAEAALAGGMDPEDLYLDVLAGAMRQIGDRWSTGEVTVAEEHQATAIVLRLLGRLGRNFTRRGRSRGTIVLGAAAGDHHGLAGALLADPLRGRRFTVVDLGPDSPPEAFVDAANRDERLVAVGITLTAPPLTPVRRTIEALRRAGVDEPALVGGAAVADEATARSVGADLWAPSGRDALELLTTAGSPPT